MKATVLFVVVVSGFCLSNAATLHWRGTTSESAAVAANWVDENGDAVASPPQNGDAIVVAPDGEGVSHAMTWDLDDVTLASWTQVATYTNTVTFQTGLSRSAKGTAYAAHGVLAADGVTRILKVTGSVDVQGGKWAHTATPVMQSSDEGWTDGKGIYRLIADIGGSFTLGAAASVDVSSMGFTTGCGPGYGAYSQGAAHGGFGCYIGSSWGQGEKLKGAKTRNCYGLVKQPTTIGSGGSGSPLGGGAIQIAVGGTATLAGSLLSNGETTLSTPSGSTWGSGAGGSIYIKAGAIAQTGTLSANGGGTGNCSPGGGGRIALVATNAADSAFGVDRSVITAYGGKSSSFQSGYNGTIYLERASDSGRGELVIKGANYSNQDHGYGYGAQLWDPEATDDYDFSKVTLLNTGELMVSKDVTLKTDAIVSDGDATTKYLYLNGGTLNCSQSELALTNLLFAFCRKIPSEALCHSCTGHVVVADGAGTFKVDNQSTFLFDGSVEISGNLRVLSTGKLTCTPHATFTTYKLTDTTNFMALAVSGDVTVDAGGKISADACGFGVATGPGKPQTSGRCGGTHGGEACFAASSEWTTRLHAPCYGSVRYPFTMGSGGSAYQAGGGILKLTVGGALTVNGAVTSRGGEYLGATENGAVSGAGGSVWVIAKTLAGAGNIGADGGLTYHYADACSGGGRVAVTLTDPTATFEAFTAAGGTITAYGGKCRNKHTKAGAGTVYLRTGAQGDREGALVIDNNGTTWQTYGCTIFGDQVTDTEVGSVVITNGAVLTLPETASVEFSGDWKTMPNSILSNAVGATVTAVGSGASTLTGTNYFYNFSCTAPGKTLNFGTTGSLFGILTMGTLTLEGEKDNLIGVRSLASGTQWPMDFTSGAIAAITYVDVQDSLNGGATVTANKSNDSGNNVGWTIFKEIVAGENIWTGAAGTADWDNAGNWSEGRTPIAGDDVIIRSNSAGAGGAPIYPTVLTDTPALKSLTVELDTSLGINATLTVTSSATIAGSLGGSGTFCLDGATANFADAEISMSGTLSVNGDQNVTLDLTGDTVGTLSLVRTGGTVSFPVGATATRVSVTGASTLAFGEGTSLTANEVRMNGLVDEVASLRLLGTGDTSWNLAAANVVRINGVRVSGSHATKLSVYATASEAVSGAANVGWSFLGAERTWTGAAGTDDFHDAANWGGTIPGASDSVIVPVGSTVVATGAVAIGALYVEGGSLRCSNTLAVATAVEVENGATLILDAPATVAGAFNLRSGGTLTHTANNAEALYRINLAVGGDLLVESGATIDLRAKGFAASYGPGGISAGSGASHGGRGCDANKAGLIKPCYGSIRRPTTLGSGGQSKGGGAAQFTVAGTFTMNGTLDAEGEPSWTAGTYFNQYVGAGGSCWVTCGTLAGSGTFDLDAGRASGKFGGGGGRFALWQTVATTTNAFTGAISAYGTMEQSADGTTKDSTPCASCGTVFYHNADDPEDGGTLVIDGKNGSNTENHGSYPAQQKTSTDFPGEDGAAAFRHATVVVTRGGSLNLTANVKLEDLIVHKRTYAAGDGSVETQLRLNGYTLEVYGYQHRKGRGWWTTKDGSRPNYTEVITVPGNLYWFAPFMLLVR